MPGLKTIRKRITSVRSTQQITKAMKMVAAAKLRRAQEAVEQARPYAERLGTLLGTLAAQAGPEAHPLLAQREEREAHLVLVTADRGLCGGYNANLIRRAEAFVREREGRVSLTIVGRKGHEYFRRRAVRVAEHASGVLGGPASAAAAGLAARVIERFLGSEADAVYLLYSRFRSALSQVPTLQRLLPVETPAAAAAVPLDYLYEPERTVVLARLLPRYVAVQITRALLEAAASEHGARMTAMDSATSNAADMINRLTLQMNRARQAAITKELMEIVSGAEALKG
jgi:F-type H+-transporting ATPase subunit gamma